MQELFDAIKKTKLMYHGTEGEELKAKGTGNNNRKLFKP
jgi:hypothetical protein